MRHFRWSPLSGKGVCGAEQTAADHLHEAAEFRSFMLESNELICKICKNTYLKRGL